MARFRRKESGQGMTEYIIIVPLIAVVGIFGDVMRNQFYNMTLGV